MKVKLTELLNTSYVYLTFCKDISFICDAVRTLQTDSQAQPNAFNSAIQRVYDAARIGTPIEFDLADAKLTRDACDTILLQLRNGSVFVDSKDSWRNDLLAENMKRLSTKIDNLTDMPVFTQDMTAPEYIKQLDKNVVYLPPIIDENIYLPLVVLTTIVRPSIQFKIDAMARGIFNYVGSHLTARQLQSYHEFYYVTNEGTRVVDFNRPVYIQGHGYGEIKDALESGYLVPTVFGKEKLTANADFLQIFKDCNAAINKYRNSRKLTLEEVLLQ